MTPEAELKQVLRDALWKAGQPSSRQIATAIGISHTAVHQAVGPGPFIRARWGNIRKIAGYLEADLTLCERLYREAAAERATGGRYRDTKTDLATAVADLTKSVTLLAEAIERLTARP